MAKNDDSLIADMLSNLATKQADRTDITSKLGTAIPSPRSASESLNLGFGYNPNPEPRPRTKEIMQKRIMIQLTINTYPNGAEYIDARAWIQGNQPKQPTARKKEKKKVEQATIQETEEW